MMRAKYSKLWVSMFLWILLVTGCPSNDSVYTGSFTISEGKNVIETNNDEWTGINRVWYYRPSAPEDSLRVVMVLHGMGRNGEDYIDSWIPYADENRLMVVAPEISDERPIGFVGSLSVWGFEYRYSTGNVVSWFSRDLPEKDWYFTSVEHLFDAFLRSDSQLMNRYVLFGHSAGGENHILQVSYVELTLFRYIQSKLNPILFHIKFSFYVSLDMNFIRNPNGIYLPHMESL